MEKNKEKQAVLLKALSESNMELDKLQAYVEKVLEIRSLNSNSLQEEMLMLVEEVGELAKAIRKDKTDMAIDKSREASYDSVESEMADIFIILLSLCSKMDISLREVFLSKENKNLDRVWSK